MSNVIAFGLWRVDWILVSNIHAKFEHLRESSSPLGRGCLRSLWKESKKTSQELRKLPGKSSLNVRSVWPDLPVLSVLFVPCVLVRPEQWIVTFPSSDQWLATIENHWKTIRVQWLPDYKTIEKPFVPMVFRPKTIGKPLLPMVLETKNHC